MRQATEAHGVSLSHKQLLPTLLALVALALGMAAAWHWQRSVAQPSTAVSFDSGVLLPAPRVVPAFTLVNQDGEAYTPEQLKGGWSLLFAGFTFCPDICPTTLQLLAQVEKQLAQSGRTLRVLFLSVDPERDTPEQLLRYVRYFSPSVTGLTGELAQIEALSAGLGLAFLKVPGSSASDYTMDHSAALVLLNPAGQVAGYFQPPLAVAALVADLSRVIPAAP